ncbi:hypothetical protein ACFXNW_11050 [Nocardia sp. NPDC059180]|uniref:hypothetical protein n=1 Tax=Nocardia sp. NPDC059180 TaxID=3346761 RepID=UPI0036C286A6
MDERDLLPIANQTGSRRRKTFTGEQRPERTGRRCLVGRQRSADLGMWVLGKSAGDVRRRPLCEFRDNSNRGIRGERTQYVHRQAGAGRQPLPEFVERVGGERTRPLRQAQALLEQGESNLRPSRRIDVIGCEVPSADQPYGGRVEACECNHLRVIQIRSTRQRLSEIRVRMRNEPIDQVGR